MPGFVVREVSPSSATGAATMSLGDYLKKHGIPASARSTPVRSQKLGVDGR